MKKIWLQSLSVTKEDMRLWSGNLFQQMLLNIMLVKYCFSPPLDILILYGLLVKYTHFIMLHPVDLKVVLFWSLMKLKSVNIHDEHQEYKHSCAETTNTAYKAGIYCGIHTLWWGSPSARILNRETYSEGPSLINTRRIQVKHLFYHSGTFIS